MQDGTPTLHTFRALHITARAPRRVSGQRARVLDCGRGYAGAETFLRTAGFQGRGGNSDGADRLSPLALEATENVLVAVGRSCSVGSDSIRRVKAVRQCR